MFYSDGGNFTAYTVQLPESAVTGSGTIALKAVAVLTDILEPFPAEIAQNEAQFVRLHDSHYVSSPYPTVSQKSSFKLGSTTIESFTKLSPFTTRGSSLQFGPFSDVPAYAVSPMAVHFMNSFPFAKFSSMSRELEVSHWGNIAVEELYELRHAGARLKGGFSRIEYQMARGGPSPSFRSLVASLPAQATNIYYRDQIGNISTSDIRIDREEGVLDLEIQTRFPMFGGWKTQFYLGYSLPTEMALFVSGDGRYNLEFDFFTPFSGVWVEQMELKVVLPEGAEDISVSVPYPVEHSTARRFTYLDSEANGGRPVIILKANNLVEQHDEQVHISYSFAQPRMLVEPLMLVCSYFCFFILCMILSRTSSISSARKPQTDPAGSSKPE